MKEHIQLLKKTKNEIAKLIKRTPNESAYKPNYSRCYRHLHIADCLLRGRKMQEIESKNHKGNAPDEKTYKLLMDPATYTEGLKRYIFRWEAIQEIIWPLIKKEPKMYIILRKDIPGNWLHPQACHVLAEYARCFPKQFADWGNQNIVVLQCGNISDLLSLQWRMDSNNVSFANFHERHQNTGKTGAAFILKEEIDDPCLAKLKLL